MKKIALIFVFIMLLSSCEKDWWKPKPKPPVEPTLPPITSEGKGTFGCLVNGKVWVTNPFFARCDYIPWYYAVRSNPSLYNGFYLIGRKNGNTEAVKIEYDSIFGPGTYKLPHPHLWHSTTGIRFRRNDSSIFYNIQMSDRKTKGYGELKIHTLDTINKIIAGTFHFKAIDENNYLDTIHITDGRFDLKF